MTDPAEDPVVWYYADQQALLERTPLGPASIRDLDVLVRTQSISSATYVWKEGMADWKQLYQVEILKTTILDEQAQLKNIQELYEREQEQKQAARQKNKKYAKADEKQEKKLTKSEELAKLAEFNLSMNKQEALGEKGEALISEVAKSNNNAEGEEGGDVDEEEDDEEEYMRLLAENPEEAIQQMVKNTMNGFFYKSEEDGLWHVCKEEEDGSRQWKEQEEEPVEEMNKMREELLVKLRAQFGEKSTEGQNQEQKGMTAEQIKKIQKNKKKAKRAAEKKKEKWYQAKINTYIYVKGLPLNITLDRIEEFFSRAGLIRRDAQTGEKKIKLYKDDDGKFKGDCVISYQMMESIEIAISMLDEREIEDGYIVKIEKANFNQHGQAYKKREIAEGAGGGASTGDKAVDLVKQKQLRAEQKNRLGWEDEDQIDVGLKIVILKNVFTLEDVESDEGFLEELRKDIAGEIERSVGQVQRIKVFEFNPEGVIEIKFKNSSDAQACIELMNGRFFDSHKLECFFWDGETDFNKNTAAGGANRKYSDDDDDDADEDERNRLEDFAKWIEQKNQDDVDGNDND